jgi:hypothetical protein
VMWFMIILCLLSCAVGFRLRETAPRGLAKRGMRIGFTL